MRPRQVLSATETFLRLPCIEPCSIWHAEGLGVWGSGIERDVNIPQNKGEIRKSDSCGPVIQPMRAINCMPTLATAITNGPS